MLTDSAGIVPVIVLTIFSVAGRSSGNFDGESRQYHRIIVVIATNLLTYNTGTVPQEAPGSHIVSAERENGNFFQENTVLDMKYYSLYRIAIPLQIQGEVFFTRRDLGKQATLIWRWVWEKCLNMLGNNSGGKCSDHEGFMVALSRSSSHSLNISSRPVQ